MVERRKVMRLQPAAFHCFKSSMHCLRRAVGQPALDPLLGVVGAVVEIEKRLGIRKACVGISADVDVVIKHVIET